MTEIELRIDTLPVVTSMTAVTLHLESGIVGVDSYSIQVEASVFDTDSPNDVRAVAVVIDDIRVPLTRTNAAMNADTLTFAGTIGSSLLPGGRIEPLLGKLLYIEVTDRTNAVATRSDPFPLIRVIDQTPAPEFPVFGAIVSDGSPTLVWSAPQLPYEYTFEVEIRTNQAVGPLVLLEEASLPGTASSYTVSRTLAPGNYFWTVAYVDAVGNRSQSPEGAFEVEK